jgi:protein-serine/threonine kinase
MAASGDGSAVPDVPTYRSNGARQTNGVDVERDEGVAAPTTAGRSKRRDAQGATAQRTTSTREHRSVPAQSTQRNQEVNYHAHAADGPIRETSDILNRLVISEPIEDLDRERERINESMPLPVTSDERSGLSIVGSEGVEDGGRGAGQRSRQDHSSSSKREKNTRFGEYFLGNTLGEGEFGKVKMGWKQEGGVQVSRVNVNMVFGS